MKVIFLDVDGVLNNSYTFSDINYEIMYGYGRRVEIEDEKVEFLKQIVDATDAKIVLSSSWRTFFHKYNEKDIVPIFEKGLELKNKLENHGLEIYDLTGFDYNGNRENEIRAYLEKHDDISGFLIIDDCMDDVNGLFSDKTIKTKFYGLNRGNLGLTEKHVPIAIDILNRKVLIKK